MGETVSMEISLGRKSYFALIPLRKVDFSRGQAAFDLLCPLISSPPLPGELRWAKLVMMPQQASVFHHPVLPSDASHLDNNRVTHCGGGLNLKLYIWVRWQKELDVKCMDCQTLRGHAFPSSPHSLSDVQRQGPLRLRCSDRAAVTCWVRWLVLVWSKWADGAWFSFQRACGWCNWSGQSEDGMIPLPATPTPPKRRTHLPGSPSLCQPASQ